MSEAQDTTERPRRGRPPNPDGALVKQNVRVGKPMWDEVADASRGEGSNTSEITRQFYAWYLGKPGAKLPRRPLARQQSMDLARVAATAVASRDTGTTESPTITIEGNAEHMRQAAAYLEQQERERSS